MKSLKWVTVHSLKNPSLPVNKAKHQSINNHLKIHKYNTWRLLLRYFPHIYPAEQAKFFSYSRFSPVMWSKLKIVAIQWIKSRIWNTIDNWYINNLANDQVSAVFHSRVICRSVLLKFIPVFRRSQMYCVVNLSLCGHNTLQCYA